MTIKLSKAEVYRIAKNQYGGILHYFGPFFIILSLLFVVHSYIYFNYTPQNTPHITVEQLKHIPMPVIITFIVASLLSSLIFIYLTYEGRQFVLGNAVSFKKFPFIAIVKFLKQIIGAILGIILISIAYIILFFLAAGIMYLLDLTIPKSVSSVIGAGIFIFGFLYLIPYLFTYLYTLVFEDKNIFRCLIIGIKIAYGNWWHWMLTVFVTFIISMLINIIVILFYAPGILWLSIVGSVIGIILFTFYWPYFLSIVIAEYENLKSFRNC